MKKPGTEVFTVIFEDSTYLLEIGVASDIHRKPSGRVVEITGIDDIGKDNFLWVITNSQTLFV